MKFSNLLLKWKLVNNNLLFKVKIQPYESYISRSLEVFDYVSDYIRISCPC